MRLQLIKSLIQLLSHLAGGGLRAFLSDDHAQPVGLHQPDVLDPGGGAGQTKERWVGRYLGTVNFFYRFLLGFGHLLTVGKTLGSDSLSNADHCRNWGFYDLVALIGDPLGPDGVGVRPVFQLAYLADV